MKKILLSALAVFSMLSASAQNEICVAPFEVEKGGKATAEVILKNDFDVAGVTINVYLPEGFSFVKKTSTGKWVKGTTWNYAGRAEDLSWSDTSKVAEKANEAGGNQQLNVVLASADEFIESGEGSILELAIQVDASVEAGVYPIVINCSKVSDGYGEYFEKIKYTSYAVVSDGTGAFAPKYVLSDTVNDALATDTHITSLDLSEVTAINGEFAYTVGKAVTAPAITADVKVVAPTSGTYGSLCSPVALPGVKCYKFTGASGDVATFTEVDDVPANEVVIIDAAVNATVTGATLASVANGNAAAGCLYVAPNGSELRRAKNAVTVPALRGTWDIAGGSNLRIALDTPTGIKMIGTAEEVLGNTYDLQGRQVENAQNGVYVVNGKKQFVK